MEFYYYFFVVLTANQFVGRDDGCKMREQNIDGTLILGVYDQNEIKRNKALTYFKQNCPIFRFAIQTFLRG